MALQKVNYEAQTDSYWVNLTPDELKLVSAFLFNTRLGHGNNFRAAAFSLMDGIEKGSPPDFMEDAANEVGLYAVLEDADGNVGASIDSPYLTFEVTGGLPPLGLGFGTAAADDDEPADDPVSP